MSAERTGQGVCVAGFRSGRSGPRLVAAVLVLGPLLCAASPAAAAIFGVPTNLTNDGRLCTGAGAPAPECTSASVPPPGFFTLTTQNTSPASGDVVHQMRFFVEVTGTTLDVRVFDAGGTGARDLGGPTSTTYTLIRPAPALTTINTATRLVEGGTITDNRLARFSCDEDGTADWTAADAGTVFGSGAGICGPIAPGLYEFRVTVTTDPANRVNVFGVEFRDAAGSPYNAYTTAFSDADADSVSVSETSFLAGAIDGNAPVASISQPMLLYPYVSRGCVIDALNYDLDFGAGLPGEGASARITDASGLATDLGGLGGGAATGRTQVRVEPTGATDLDVFNYGLWALTNDTGTQSNVVDWRFSDFKGDVASGAGLPQNPMEPIRAYLPNGYAPAGGAPAGVAPREPVILVSARVASGANPPEAGLPTTFALTVAVYNPGPGPLTSLSVNTALPAGAVFEAGSETCFVDDVDDAANCSYTNGTVGGIEFHRVARTAAASLDVGQTFFYTLRYQMTPSAAGLLDLAAPPTTSPTLDGMVYASYAPAFSSTTFPRTEVLGPACAPTVEVVGAVDLAVTMADLTDPVPSGGTIVYQVAASNAGPTAAPNVSLSLPVPGGTTFAAVTPPGGWTCTTPPVGGVGTVVCTTGSLAAGGSGSFSYSLRVDPATPPGAVITAGAAITGGGRDANPANNTASAATTVVGSADLALAKAVAPSSVTAGGDLTFTLQVTNLGPGAAVGVALVDSTPAGTTFVALVGPPGWSCAAPPPGGTGAITCTTAALAASQSATLSLVVRVDAGATPGTVIPNAANLASATLDPVALNNGAAAAATVAAAVPNAVCATPGKDGPGGTLSGVVNTYHPGNGTVASGATSIPVLAPVGAPTPITAGDLLLVIQMQDATIDFSNTGAYGDGVAGDPARGSTDAATNNAGRYEFVVATGPVAGGAVPISGAGPGGGLVNGYVNAGPTATHGRQRYQVVRVPQYTTATLSSGLVAARWTGRTGGVLAVDVAGTLSLGGATVNLSGFGFRGGGARQVGGGGGGTDADYRNLATLSFHGSKGEGIAGRPRYFYNEATGTVVNTGVEGYPGGSTARGAPGNAGGGGTDSRPAANDQNSGGGGGGNGGIGGQGGFTWQAALDRGGFGGDARPGGATGTQRLYLGGGGGAGTRNNSSGALSSGGAGGGLILVRAGTVAGTGTLRSDGSAGLTPLNDGGGGGGAGGTIVVIAASGGLGGLTVQARGGRGADAWPLQPPGGTPGERHGPGGGGGGGVVLLSAVPAAIDVSGGPNGTTTTVLDPFGATPGQPGTQATSVTDITGLSGGAACVADLFVTKADTPDPALLGDTLTYTIVATNGGGRAGLAATVNDTLPAGVAFLSAFSSQGTCSLAGAVVTCGLGVLPPGGSATITITTTATATGTLTNTASAASATTDPDASNNTATATTAVGAAADLAVTLTPPPDPLLPGVLLTYAATVANHGPSIAASPSLTIPTPANTTFQSIAPPAGWTCATPPSGGTGTVVCTSVSLGIGTAAGFSLVLATPVGLAAGTVITADASVASATVDPVAPNNLSVVSNVVGPIGALPTRATLAGLRVERSGLVEFATATQHGTASFDLYVTNDPAGRDELVRLNDAPIAPPRPDTRTPTLYSVQTRAIAEAFLIVEETDVRGRRHAMGPFPVEGPRLRAAYDRAARRIAAAGGVEKRGRHTSRWVRDRQARQLLERAGDPRALARAIHARRIGREGAPSAARIETRGAGEIVLLRAALAERGLPARLPLRAVRLTHLGQPVGFRVDAAGAADEALVFQAEALSTLYSGRNAYVVSWGAPAPAPEVPLSIPEPGPPAGFVRVEKTYAFAWTAPLDLDPWTWDVLAGDGSSWPDPAWAPAPDVNLFDLPGLVPPSGDVDMSIHLFSMSAGRHVVEAWLDGVSLGRVEFEGAVPAVLRSRMPGSALRAVGNDLQMRYTATDTAPGDLGFVHLRHIDLAVALDRSGAQATVESVEPYDPSLPRLGQVDYLVVTHPLFTEAARRVAAAKAAEGWRVAVVDAERAYDRFSGGVFEARSLHALVREAARHGRLRHVLLVGDSTFDPRDFFAQGAVAFIPSLYGWDDGVGRVASENRYADVDGDGAPDVAIGRLPAQSPEQAASLADKIVGQQGQLDALQPRHLFVADNNRPDRPSFLAEARAVAASLPGIAPFWSDLAAGVDAARTSLAAAVAQGVAVTHYFGHGGPLTWADERLLDADEALQLSGQAGVVLTWACLSQDYEFAVEASVGEALVLNPQGGALASFGPAGLTDFGLQAALYRRVYAQLAEPGATLGEAIRRAKAGVIAEEPWALQVVEGWNLLGDPALRLGGGAAMASSAPAKPAGN